MEKIFIQNRKRQKVAVVVEEAENANGLAFVMHGLGGFKEQPHIETLAEAFKDKGYTIVRFDTTNTLGESDGKYEDATVTNYYEDLEDVISWAKHEIWYTEPFVLAGHSLGGLCVTLYAEKYPEKVRALLPNSATFSFDLWIETYDMEALRKWQETGYVSRENASRPGVMKKLNWNFVEDLKKHTALPKVHKLTMPVLLIVAEYDNRPLSQQQPFYDRLPGKKELHIIKGAPHTFRELEHLAELKKITSEWIDTI